MQKKPLITILVNCYNGEKYLKKAIQSIIFQTYKNWEVIFWDNCSTDKSSAIIKSFKDKRIKYFKSKKHTTLYKARNYAFQKSRGDLIAFLDVDDYWNPKNLEYQIDSFEDSRVGISCAHFLIKNENTKKIKKRQTDVYEGFATGHLLKNYNIGLATLIIRRLALSNLHNKYPFDSRFSIIGDFDIIIKISQKWKINTINKILSVIRIHNNNFTKKNIEILVYEFKLWIKNNLILRKKFKTEFKFIVHRYLYYKAILMIQKKKKIKALNIFLRIPFGRLKFILLLKIILSKVI
jgi:glycosyltransferase involved in cell wall biosynthesis